MEVPAVRSLSRPAGERRDRHKPVRRLCAASSGRRARRFRPGGRRGREYLAVDPPADVGLGRLEFWPAGSQRPGFRACFSRPLTRSPGAGDGRLVAGDLSPITASYVNKRPDRTQACPRPHDGPATVSSLRPLVARQLRCAPSPPPRHATPLSRVVPAVRPSDFGRNPGITAVLDRA